MFLSYFQGAHIFMLGRVPSLLLCDRHSPIKYFNLSHDVAVMQWITSSHNNRNDHTCNNTLARRCNVADNVHVNNAFLIEIMIIFKVINSHFKGSYDKQNPTLVVISLKFISARQRVHMKKSSLIFFKR